MTMMKCHSHWCWKGARFSFFFFSFATVTPIKPKTNLFSEALIPKVPTKANKAGNMAKRVKSSFLHLSWLRDLSSARIQVSFLRLSKRRFASTIIILLGGFKQAANSLDKNSMISTRTLDHCKLLSSFRFLQARMSYRIEKWADSPIVSVWRCMATER